MKLKSVLTVLTAVIIMAASAAVKTTTWTGGAGDFSWATAGNWDQGVPAKSGDYVIFNTTIDQPITLNGDKSVGDFFMSGCSAVFTTDVVGAKRQLTANVKNGVEHGGVFLEYGTLEAAGSNNTVAVQGASSTTSAILGSGAVLKASDGGQVTLKYGKIAADAKNVKFIATGKQGATCSKVNESSWYPTTMTLTDENTGFSFEAYDGGIVNIASTLNFVTNNNPVFIADGGQLTLSKAVITGGSDLFVTNKNAGVTTLGAITGNPTILAESGKVTTGAIVGNSTIDASSGAIVTPATKVTGNTTITAKDARTYITMPAVVGHSTVECADSATVKFSSTIAGNVDSKATNGAYVWFVNALSTATEPYKFFCDNATNTFGKGVTGTVVADCANNGKITFYGITGSATVTSTNGAIVTTGAVSANADMFAKDAGSSITLSSFGVAGGNSKLKASDAATITSGATKGSVAIEADKGSLVKITSTMAAGTHSITSTDANSTVWIQGGVTGATTIDASDKGTVKLANSSGSAQTITGTTTISAVGEGTSVQLAGFGAAGTDSSVTATGKALVKATGSVAGNVIIDADESSVTVGAVAGTAKVTSTGAGSSVALTSTIGKGDSEFTCTDSASITVGSTISGNVKVDCDESSYVKFSGAISGNLEMETLNHGYVWFANTLGSTTAPMVYAFDCDAATNRFDKAVAGAVTIDAKNGANMTLTSGFGAAGKSSSLTATEQSTVTSGVTLGNMAIVADKGSKVTLTSSIGSGTHSIVCSNEDSVVWIQGAVTGATTIDATDKGTVKLVNAAGTTYQKIDGATAISCVGDGTAVQLAGFGKASLNSSVVATDKGSVLTGASLGNVTIEADKGSAVTLAGTMGTGAHKITCSNENSVVWIRDTVTGNPVIICEDKGTVKLVKADNTSLIGISGYPTVTCSGDGSSVTMGNLGATAAGVNVLKAKDGATVTVGTTKFTIQAEASNGALLKMGSVTPSANDNKFIADNATIQFTGAFNGNKSFTSYYEVIGENGLIEGANVAVSIGTDAKTTVKLTPLVSRSTPYIKTTTGGNLTFGAGVQYVIDVTDINDNGKPFFGDKKILVAEAAGTLTYNKASSVTTVGTDAGFYTASFTAVDKQLFLVLNCTKVPEGKKAVVGTEDFYESVAEALAAVPDNGLVAILDDATVEAAITIPAGKTVTLNVNGKTLTNATQGSLVDNAGTLTLKGNGNYVGSNADAALVRNAPTGVLTIEDGTFENVGVVVDNEANEESAGELTVKTGSFTSTGAKAIRNWGTATLKAGAFAGSDCAVANLGTATLSAGTYTGSDCAVANLGTATLSTGTYTGAYAVSNSCIVTISGGTFTGNAYALYNCCTAAVSKGTFDGVVSCNTGIGDLAITGGAFGADVTASDGASVSIPGLVGASLNTATFVNDETGFCEEGYLTFLNGEVYVVRRNSDVIITAVNADESKGTLTVENVGTTITELGVTLRGTITNVAEGYVPVVNIGQSRVEVAADGRFEGPAVKSAEVFVAYVKPDAWYLDPFVRNKFTLKGTYSPIGTIMDEDESIIVQNGDPGSDNYGIASVLTPAARNSVNPKLGYLWNRGAAAGGKHSCYRQMAVSSYHQAVFGCPWYASDNAVYVVPFDPAKDFKAIAMDWGEMPNLTTNMFWGFPIGEKIYYRSGRANASGGSDIYEFSVVKDGDEITGLKAERLAGAGADAPCGRLIGGVPYAYTWNKSSVQVVNLNDGSVVTNVIDASALSSVRRTQITGVANGTPHLVLQGDAGIGIYALTADMLHLASATPVILLPGSSLGVGDASWAGTAAFDDEKTYVFCKRDGQFHIFERKPENLIVRGTFSDEAGAEADRLVPFGTEASVTFDAPAGKKITAVKVDGTAISGFKETLAYTYTSDALAKNVYIEMTLADRKLDFKLMNEANVYFKTNILWGTTVVKPADPVKENYNFKGWTNGVEAVAFDFATPITDDMTLGAWFEEKPHFVIRVANVGDKGALTVEGVGAKKYVGETISGKLTDVATGYNAYVFVGGAKVEVAQDGSFSGTVTDKSADVAVTYVKDDAWYLDPFVKNDVDVGKSYASRVGTAVLNGDDSHLLMASDWNNVYAAYNMVDFHLLNAGSFSQLIGSYLGTPINSVSIQGGGYAQGIVEHQQESFNGYVECGDFILASPSQGTCKGGVPVVMPVAGNWGGYTNGMATIEANPGDRYYPSVFDINNGTMPGAKGASWPNGLQWSSRAVVSTDKKSIYFNIYARNEITKATVGTDGAGKVTITKSGTFWRTWTDQTVHASHAANALALFNDGTKDIVLAALADGRLVKLDEQNLSGNTYTNCYSVEKSEPAFVQDHAMIEIAATGFACNTMNITGVADGTPHLVCQFAGGNTKVYALNKDGTLVSETPIVDIAATDYGAPQCWNTLAAQDNEIFAYGAYSVSTRSHLTTITAKPVNVIVRSTFTTYEEGVNTEVAYGVSASKTFNAPTGKKITAVKVNGVADKNFTDDAYTFTDEALVKNVYIEMTTEDKTFDVTLMDGETTYYTTNIVYNTTVDKPADPVKEGFTFKGWTNETYTTAFDFATPITADLTLFAWYEVAVGPAPTDPEKPTEYKDEKAAADAAAAINADKKNLIKSPYEMSSAVKATYVGYFTAVVDGKTVVVVMNSEGTNAVVTAEQTAGEAALTAVLGTDEESATLDVEAPLAGFYYSLKQNAAVDKLDYATEGDKNKLGGRDAISFSLDKSASSGFYQMIVTPTQVK